MGDEGIGPSTSVLSGQRSTTELIARLLWILSEKVCLVKEFPKFPKFPKFKQKNRPQRISLWP